MRRSYTVEADGPTKSGKVRSVPLVDQAARALDQLSRRDRWTADNDRVFVNDLGEHIEDSALRRRFYRALDAAGLPHIRFHDLRHTFGTIAVQAFPLTDVKAFMGHADIQTTMIYIHHVPQLVGMLGALRMLPELVGQMLHGERPAKPPESMRLRDLPKIPM